MFLNWLKKSFKLFIKPLLIKEKKIKSIKQETIFKFSFVFAVNEAFMNIIKSKYTHLSFS